MMCVIFSAFLKLKQKLKPKKSQKKILDYSLSNQ